MRAESESWPDLEENAEDGTLASGWAPDYGIHELYRRRLEAEIHKAGKGQYTVRLRVIRERVFAPSPFDRAHPEKADWEFHNYESKNYAKPLLRSIGLEFPD